MPPGSFLETLSNLCGCAPSRFLAMKGTKASTATPGTAVNNHCKCLDISKPDAIAIRALGLSAPRSGALLALLLLIYP
jgi:hypothetical protein